MIRLASLAAALAFGLPYGAPAQTTAPSAPNEPTSEQLPRFDLLELRVVGNSVLPALAIETAVYPMLGPNRTIRDVERARDALERAYREQGFLTVAVDIPEQKVKRGTVTLRVTQGRIGRLSIKGNRYYSRGMIREKVPSLAAGSVPNFQDVQEELAALGKNENRRITPTLRPGKLAQLRKSTDGPSIRRRSTMSTTIRPPASSTI